MVVKFCQLTHSKDLKRSFQPFILIIVFQKKNHLKDLYASLGTLQSTTQFFTFKSIGDLPFDKKYKKYFNDDANAPTKQGLNSERKSLETWLQCNCSFQCFWYNF
jgi:hypothetical protein